MHECLYRASRINNATASALAGFGKGLAKKFIIEYHQVKDFDAFLEEIAKETIDQWDQEKIDVTPAEKSQIMTYISLFYNYAVQAFKKIYENIADTDKDCTLEIEFDNGLCNKNFSVGLYFCAYEEYDIGDVELDLDFDMNFDDIEQIRKRLNRPVDSWFKSQELDIIRGFVYHAREKREDERSWFGDDSKIFAEKEFYDETLIDILGNIKHELEKEYIFSKKQKLAKRKIIKNASKYK